MGYYILHRIRIINAYNTEENLTKLMECIEKISGLSFQKYGSVLKDYKDEEIDLGYSWYECENNMIAVSKFLPELEIQVKGKGEEGEIWEMIFKDGYSYSNDPSIFSDPDSGFAVQNAPESYRSGIYGGCQLLPELGTYNGRKRSCAVLPGHLIL
jgi:hypothetical protein